MLIDHSVLDDDDMKNQDEIGQAGGADLGAGNGRNNVPQAQNQVGTGDVHRSNSIERAYQVNEEEEEDAESFALLHHHHAPKDASNEDGGMAETSSQSITAPKEPVVHAKQGAAVPEIQGGKEEIRGSTQGLEECHGDQKLKNTEESKSTKTLISVAAEDMSVLTENSDSLENLKIHTAYSEEHQRTPATTHAETEKKDPKIDAAEDAKPSPSKEGRPDEEQSNNQQKGPFGEKANLLAQVTVRGCPKVDGDNLFSPALALQDLEDANLKPFLMIWKQQQQDLEKYLKRGKLKGDANLTDSWGRSLADYCATRGEVQMMEIVFRHGGTCKVSSKPTMRALARARAEVNKAWKERQIRNSLFKTGMVFGGVLAGVASIPIFLGFGTGGIVAGSAAAGMQSAIGNVAAGSAFAAAQSAGATGTFAAAQGAGGWLFASSGLAQFFNRGQKEKEKQAAEATEEEIEELSDVEKYIRNVTVPGCGPCSSRVWLPTLALQDFQKSIFAAIYHGNMKDFLEVFTDTPYVDLNELDSWGRTPADFAAVCGRLKMFQFLMATKREGDCISAKCTLAHKPTLLALTRARNTARSLFSKMPATPDSKQNTDDKNMAFFGLDLSSQLFIPVLDEIDLLESCFLAAVYHGPLEELRDVVETVTEEEMNQVDAWGRTPADVAALLGRRDMYDYLVHEKGGYCRTSSRPLNELERQLALTLVPGCAGPLCTPMLSKADSKVEIFSAIYNGFVQDLEAVLEEEGDEAVNRLDCQGRTPLDLCAIFGRQEMFGLIAAWKPGIAKCKVSCKPTMRALLRQRSLVRKSFQEDSSVRPMVSMSYPDSQLEAKLMAVPLPDGDVSERPLDSLLTPTLATYEDFQIDIFAAIYFGCPEDLWEVFNDHIQQENPDNSAAVSAINKLVQQLDSMGRTPRDFSAICGQHDLHEIISLKAKSSPCNVDTRSNMRALAMERAKVRKDFEAAQSH